MAGVPQDQMFSLEHYRKQGLSEEKIMDLKDTFDLFDRGAKGFITPKDLRDVMFELGFEAKNQTIYQMISSLDKNGSGAVDFMEFLEVMTSRDTHRDNREDIEKVFRLFDRKGSGFITVQSLKSIIRELGENITDEEILEMVAAADINHDGVVSLDEFFGILTKNKFP